MDDQSEEKFPQAFDFYCPIQTFGRENPSKVFRDRDGITLKRQDFFCEDDEQGFEIGLAGYFSKAKLCFDALVEQARITNPNLEMSELDESWLNSWKVQLNDLAIEMVTEIYNRKHGLEVYHGNDRVDDADALEFLLKQIRSSSDLDVKFEFFRSFIQPEDEKFPFRELVFPFAALQRLDYIVLCELHYDVGSPAYAAAKFHDCYFLGIKYVEVINESTLRAAKQRVKPATEGKLRKTKTRDEFINALFLQSKKSRMEFSRSSTTLDKVNAFSRKIGIAELSPYSDKIYRVLKPDSK